MSRRRGRRGKRNVSARNPSKRMRLAGPRDRAQEQTDAPAAKALAEETSRVVALEPTGPVIVRSGRPFDGQAGPDAARFPPPSTIAGCLRTAWARETGQDFGLHLRALAVAGPLLLGRNNQVLVPKPADARYLRTGDAASCSRAEPHAFEGGSGSDMPDGLMPVQLTRPQDGKPGTGPSWWSLSDLLDFRSGEDVALAELTKRGWSPGAGDRRTHVAISRERGAAEEGRLFQTEGLVFDGRAGDAADGGVRLLARVDEPLGPALAHLGGERRLAALEPQEPSVWPAPRPGWLQDIADAGGLSLTLLTPGIFKAGYRPGWLDEKLIGSPPAVPGLTLQLCAAATERWQPHSGWDLAAGRPRPTRKLAPAGSTYWFRILEGADQEALGSLWLANVSDEEQDRLDGFGLALPSAWQPVAAQGSTEERR